MAKEVAVEAAKAAGTAASAGPSAKARQDLRVAGGLAPTAPTGPPVAAPRAAPEASARAKRQRIPLGPSRHRPETSVLAVTALARPVPVVRAGQAAKASAAAPVAPGPGAKAQPARGAALGARPTKAAAKAVPVPVAVAGARSSVEELGVRPVGPATASPAAEARQRHALLAVDAARPIDVDGAPEARPLVAHLRPDTSRRPTNPSGHAAPGPCDLPRVLRPATSARVAPSRPAPARAAANEETKVRLVAPVERIPARAKAAPRRPRRALRKLVVHSSFF